MSTLRKRIEKLDKELKTNDMNCTVIFVEGGETNDEAIIRTGNQDLEENLIIFVRFADPEEVGE